MIEGSAWNGIEIYRRDQENPKGKDEGGREGKEEGQEGDEGRRKKIQTVLS